MPPPPGHSSSKPKPWPGYFLVRTTGEVVPLIAVDELPPGTDLVGIPRSLDLEATIGMYNLGLQRSSGVFYQLVKKGDEKVDLVKVPEPTSASESTNQRPTKPSGIPAHTISNTLPRRIPDTQPQTCRHWCTHGICKWGQNCHYRHIMPMTLPGLQEIGLNDWPAWYRNLNPGYFAGNVREDRLRGLGRRDRARARAGMMVGQIEYGCIGGGGYLGGCRGLAKGEQVEEKKGEMVLEKLRGLEGVGEKGFSKNVILERAAVKETRDWEDESIGSEGGDKSLVEEKKAKIAKEKLVDI